MPIRSIAAVIPLWLLACAAPPASFGGDAGTSNTAPVAVDDTAVTSADAAVTVDVLSNDSDADGDTLSVSAVDTPAIGSAAIADDAVTYTPTGTFLGTDTFSYTVTDGTDTATADIAVTVAEDTDGDGVLDPVDNCPDDANADQTDADADGIGAECDSDDDGDELDDDVGFSGGGCSASGLPGALLALAALAALLGWRRLSAAGLVLALLAPSLARAQIATDFPVERLQPALDPFGINDVESGDAPPHLSFDVALTLAVSDDPLVAYQTDDDGVRTELGGVVAYRVAGNLGASVSLLGRIELGFDLPVVLAQGEGTVDGVPTIGLATSAVGDLRLAAKVQLLTADSQHVDLAIVPVVTAPTGSATSYVGEGGLTFAPMIAASRVTGALTIGGNLGYRVRSNHTLVDLTVDDELFAKLGAGYDLAGVGVPVSALASISIATAAADPFASFDQNYVELTLGASYRAGASVRVFAAGGLGLAEGFGSPDVRAVAGVRFTRVPPPRIDDPDADGVPTEHDLCPDEPEDVDGYQDADGCPDGRG